MKANPQDHDFAAAFRRPLEYIALWQLICFLALIILIWVNALYDLSNLFFGTPEAEANWLGALTLSAVTLFVAILTIGNTFLQQKRILSGFLVVCSYCRKVKVQEAGWQMLDHYLVDRTLALISHGICPTCAEKVLVEHGLPPDALKEAEAAAHGQG